MNKKQMGTVRRFEDLECWRAARELCKRIYKITQGGEFIKDYHFKNQINDSSGSGMDNIAEGFDRGGNREFIQFLFIAKGSIGETKSQLYRTLDRKYISQEVFNDTYEITESASRQISKLADYLMSSDKRGVKFK